MCVGRGLSQSIQKTQGTNPSKSLLQMRTPAHSIEGLHGPSTRTDRCLPGVFLVSRPISRTPKLRGRPYDSSILGSGRPSVGLSRVLSRCPWRHRPRPPPSESERANDVLTERAKGFAFFPDRYPSAPATKARRAPNPAPSSGFTALLRSMDPSRLHMAPSERSPNAKAIRRDAPNPNCSFSTRFNNTTGY